MRRQGGINNAALFGASQRSARDKLETMGGIQRNPRGILASSSALMQAVAPRPMAPAPMTPPPPMMPMVQPVVLPQVPMQTTVAPMVQQAPVQQQQQASMNPMQQAPIKLEDGGKIDVTKSPTAAPMTKLQLAMFNVGSGIYEKVLGKYGSEEKAKEEIVKKKDEIEEVTSTTDNPVEIANAVLTSMGEEPTDDNKRDVAENVFGLTDVNDIDAINDRIAKVAVASTIGGGTQGTDKLATALLLGLNSYKQTAAARASGGGGDYTPERLRQRTIEAILKKPDQFNVYNEDGSVDPVKVQREADILVRSMQQTPVPQTNDLPTISTEEEYNALPSGAEFMQNGQKRRKP
tara:strand:- start:404 stop:1447 length:1044 start_codon:yes stop_codon:yes gene_type:complete